jgi:transposase
MALRLRVSSSHRNGKTYRYHQLVRAIRKNGRPTHEVVAHLGQLTKSEVEAMKKGLASLIRGSIENEESTSKDSAGDILVRLKDVQGLAARRYLDLMVVRSLWNEWGFSDFFDQNVRTGSFEISPTDVIFVLVANRCVAPCSKLRVTEWTPNTCLPQLLGFQPKQINNTRIHRVLDELNGIDPALSRFLINHPIRRRCLDSVVFLDLTNTWFEGHGGTMGERSKTKDGAIRRHVIQIALGVDASGLPLQWEVLPGKTAEVNVLPSWIESLGSHETLRELPLVFDRGLTSEKNLFALVHKNRKFVTCARESQIENWNTGVNVDALARLPIGITPDRKTLEAAGLRATEDDDIFHVDLGVRSPPRGMPTLTERGLRVVPYFRPTLYLRNRDSLERVCLNVEGKVAAINDELRSAKRNRTLEAVRCRVDQLLNHFQVQDEYSIRFIELNIDANSKQINAKHNNNSTKKPPKNSKPRKQIRSFQIVLDRVAAPNSRTRNAGWMVLLAHPDDNRSALELIRQYHQKEVVEHDFGIIKSVVELRPIRHQTDLKIKAHVSLCVLALHLNRVLELKLHAAGIHDAIDRIYETLEPCRLHVLADRSGRIKHSTITQVRPEQMRLLVPLGLSRLVGQEAIRVFSSLQER